MTGNDIVDMKTAAVESNWKRKGFLEKLFTQQEQRYIKDAATPLQMVWRLWTMKESAYKIYTRQYGGRFFGPQKLNCTLVNETDGQVVIHTKSYQTTTNAAKDYIYTVAWPEETSKIGFYNCCFGIPGLHQSGQQKFIYKKMIAGYAVMKGEDKKNFTIIKDKKNVPYLYCKREKLTVPVSITHHGNYAAFTIN